MKTWVRRPALTLIAAAAIALALAGWSGSQEAHTGRLKSGAAVPGAVPSAPAAALRAPGLPDPQFARCDAAACPSEADSALFEVEAVSAGEPWSPIVVGAFADAPPDIYDRPSGISLASIEPSATASPAPELSTAAMVALGVVLLTARRARRNRWASWKAPWRVSAVPASG
jgi:MYXO-CTERM domain-containing protein